MTIRKLPEPRALQRPASYQWDAPSDVLARWAENPQAAEADDPNTISIYDVIGTDFWTGGGFTAKRAAAALRSIGAKDVTVRINSPGGDMFEGLAIYNILREHPAKVTVEVAGIAASAASVIAMAADEIRMGLGTFIMVHNAWGAVVGNRHDFRAAADIFDGFDGAMADIYEARTGLKRADIVALMDAETYMGAKDAVAKGFADTVAESRPEASARAEIAPAMAAKRRLDSILAQQGVPRSERRKLLREATAGMRDAADDATQDAGLDVAAVQRLIATIRS